MATVKYFITSEDKTQAGVKSARKGLQDLENQGSRTTQKMVVDATKMVAGFAGIAVSVTAVTKAITQFSQESLKSFRENERIFIRLNAAARNAGGSFDSLTNNLGRLSRITLATGTQLNDLAARFLQLGHSQTRVEQLMEASVHYANATGESIEGVATKLAQTLEGTATGLSRLVPGISSLTAEQLRNGEAIELVTGRLSEFSELTANTSSQTIKNFQDSMDSLKTTIGQQIAQAWDPLIKRTTDWITQLERAMSLANEYSDTVGGAIAGNLTPGVDTSAIERQMGILQRELQDALEIRTFQQMEFGANANTTALDNQIEALQKTIGSLRDSLINQQREERLRSLAITNNPAVTQNTSAVESLTDTVDELLKTETKAFRNQQFANKQMQVLSGNFNKFANVIQSWDMRFLNPGGLGARGSIADLNMNTLDNGGYSPGVEIIPATGVNPGSPTFLENFGKKMGELGGGFVDMLSGLTPLIGSLNSVRMIMDPIGIILNGIMDVLGPLIDQALAPLVGIFTIIGQVVGQILAPAFQILAPIIEMVSKIFVWFHNNVMRPIGNALITLVGTIWNTIAWAINGVISLINKIPGVNIRKVATMDIEGNKIQAISTSQLTQTGQNATTGGVAGSSAQYTGGKNYTVNVSVFTSVLTGDNGFEQLARRLRNEIERQTALGF